MNYIKLICIICATFVSVEGFAQGKINRPTKRVKQQTSQNVQTNVVKVSKPDGFIANHGYVDLGLPSGLKWATCNIGASSPSGYGNYYAWGETTSKTIYTEKNSKMYNKKMEDISGNPQYDSARNNWGGSWRLPKENEIKELVRECKWDCITLDGHMGYKGIGPNGKSIFLPAAGFRSEADDFTVGDCGFFWSSTPSQWGAESFCFFHNPPNIISRQYYVGQSVRPVSH